MYLEILEDLTDKEIIEEFRNLKEEPFPRSFLDVYAFLKIFYKDYSSDEFNFSLLSDNIGGIVVLYKIHTSEELEHSISSFPRDTLVKALRNLNKLDDFEKNSSSRNLNKLDDPKSISLLISSILNGDEEDEELACKKDYEDYYEAYDIECIDPLPLVEMDAIEEFEQASILEEIMLDVNPTPLHEAVYRRDLEEIKFLLEQGANPNITNTLGQTPLNRVALSNWEDKKAWKKSLGLLITKENVNIADEDGNTPLHEITFQGNIEGIKILLEKGADLNATNVYGQTPLYRVALSKWEDEKAWKEAVGLLITKENVNMADEDGNTPLHEITFQGNIEGIKILLEKGADLNATNVYGQTPLHIVAFSSNWVDKKAWKEAVGLLITKENVNMADKDGDTPLHEITFQDNVEGIKILLEEGANPNETNFYGQTPLHRVASLSKWDKWEDEKAWKEAIGLLITKENVNIVDEDGNTPLHEIVFQADVEVIKMFLEKEVNLNTVNSYGYTPWDKLNLWADKKFKDKAFELLCAKTDC